MFLKQTIKANNDSAKESMNVYSKLTKPLIFNSTNLLTIILVVLNLFGAEIPWIWVFAPIWITVALILSLVIVVAAFYVVASMITLFMVISSDLIDKYVLPMFYKEK